MPTDPRTAVRQCPSCRSLSQFVLLDGVDQCWWCGLDDASRPRAGRESEEGVEELAGEL